MKIAARALLMTAAVVALAGTAATAPAPSSGAVSSGGLDAGGACTARATKALVRAFVRGFDRGEVRIVDRMWAPTPRFQWFSSGAPGARLGGRARDRSTLAAYFRMRVRVRERIRLTLLAAGYDPARNIVDFSGKLVRTAEDIRPRGPQDFKGAADCLAGRPLLVVWSM